jgi:hypothetical protein
MAGGVEQVRFTRSPRPRQEQRSARLVEQLAHRSQRRGVGAGQEVVEAVRAQRFQRQRNLR